MRLDPLTWILEGQLGVELEVGVTSWLSLETVPMFVTDESPPWLHIGGGDSRVYQSSNGWGALSGATLGVNFWLSKLFRGSVIRTGLINYGLEYETRRENGDHVDGVQHTKRQFYAMFGSVSRWSAFTFSAGLGLGYELNKETRCFPGNATSLTQAAPGNCDEIQIAVPRSGTNVLSIVPVTPFTYPWEILGRLSLGVTID